MARVSRGALVEYAVSLPPLVLMFEFNPEQISRSRTITVRTGNAPGTRGGYDFVLPTETPRVAQGVTVQPETLTIDVLFDATDRMSKGDPIASVQGVQPELDTLRAMFDALRTCWIPPARDEARAGMQMSVRFAFRRSGEIIATPRVTYVSPSAPPEARETYLHAINAALERCTPLPFSQGLGGAVAGRPIAIRFVDNRDKP